MANMAIKPVYIDVWTGTCSKATCTQGEANSRTLEVYFRDGENPYDITNTTVTLYMTKSDGNNIFNDGTIVNGLDGVANFELTTQTMTLTGEYPIEFRIVGGEPSLIKLEGFTLKIQQGKSDTAIESTNEMGALTTALITVSSYDGRITANTNDIADLKSNKISTVKVNGIALTQDTNHAVDVLCATSAQGTKADSAIQGIQGGGVDIAPDANKKVNITPANIGAATSAQGTLATNAVSNTFTLNSHALSGASLNLTANDVGALPSTTKIKMDKILTAPVTFAALNTEYTGSLGFPAGLNFDSYAYFIVKIGTEAATENVDVIIDADTKKSAWLDYETAGYHASGYIVIGATSIAVSCKECVGWTLSQLSLSQVYGVRLG